MVGISLMFLTRFPYFAFLHRASSFKETYNSAYIYMNTGEYIINILASIMITISVIATIISGWKYLKDYSKSSTKYKYYFKKDGKLVTDLFKQFGSSYKKKRMKIRLNLTTHNITFYLYDYAKKQYIIPAKTVVCSTARDGKSTYVGNHYLAKSTARRWFIYKKSKPWHFYQWGVWVHGTKSWIHSEMYRSTNNRRLIADTYNGLGTNQTTACIHVQAGNAKLVYDIAKSNPYRVYVQIYRSSNRGPFGKVTLSSTTGKISKKQTYDPTDPAFS